MTAAEHTGRQRTFADYLAVLRRRKWIAILPILLVPIVAYVVASREQPVYAASSDVLLSRDNLGSALAGITNADVLADPDRFAQTQARLARAPEVFRRAAELADAGVSPQEIVENSSVTALGNADLLTFTVSNVDPELAVRVAGAYAEAFTDYRLDLDTAALASARRDLERTAASLRAAGGADSPQYRELVRKAQELRTMELLQTPAAVVKVPTNAGQIAPTPRRDAMLGLALGLLLGIGAALLWEALDKRVRDEDELHRALELPLLARLPAPRTENGRPQLAMLDDSADAEAEEVRRLRSNVEFANLDVNAKTIMVTSAVAGEGKSMTIANLALALARSGRRVVLVDLDLRKPTIGHLMGLEYRPGLTDVAIGRIELEKALVAHAMQPPAPISLARRESRRSTAEATDDLRGTPGGELLVLPAGFLPASPGELVGTQAVAKILAQLEETADFVLVDAPPLLAVSDAVTLSTRVDALLVVTRLGVVNRPMIRELARQLEASPARKLGFVLTGTEVAEVYGAAAYTYRRSRRETAGQRTASPEATSFMQAPVSELPDAASQRRSRPAP